jgi:ankyrin repeat protein
VSALLAAGVPADATDSDGRTALFFASANGHAAVVQLLLANGAVRACVSRA